MAAPTFVGAGTGVVITGASGTVNADIAGLAVGDLVILHVLIAGTGAFPTYAATNIADLAGTANAVTHFGNGIVGATTVAQHSFKVGRITSTSSPAITISGATDDLYCRIYAFRGVHTGSTVTDIYESASTATRGTSATITDSAVTTTGADRLALQFVAVNDDNALGPFTGMTGGAWTEPVAEFLSAAGNPDGCIQLQIAEIGGLSYLDGAVGSNLIGDHATNNQAVAQSFVAPYTGTITTVTVRLRTFGTPTDDLIVEVRTDASGSPSTTVLGTATLDVTSATIANYQAAVAAPITSGATYWIVVRRSGSYDLANYYGWNVHTASYGTKKTYDGSAWTILAGNANTFAISGSGAAGTIDGGSYTMAASDPWGVYGFALIPAPSGPTTFFGATVSAYTFAKAVAATRKTFAQLAAPFTTTISVAGVATTPGVTHYGATTLALTAGRAVNATRIATGQVAAPFTFTKTVAAQRKTFGQVLAPLVFTKAVGAQRKTFGQLTAPFTFTKAVAAQRKVFAQVAAPFTFTKAVVAQRKTFGQVARPIIATVTTNGIVITVGTHYGAVVMPVTFGKAVAAQRKTFGVVARPINLTVSTEAQHRPRLTGSARLEITNTVTTTGHVHAFATTTTPIQATVTTTGVTSMFVTSTLPITFGVSVFVAPTYYDPATGGQLVPTNGRGHLSGVGGGGIPEAVGAGILESEAGGVT